eukprot:g5092.t1
MQVLDEDGSGGVSMMEFFHASHADKAKMIKGLETSIVQTTKAEFSDKGKAVHLKSEEQLEEDRLKRLKRYEERVNKELEESVGIDPHHFHEKKDRMDDTAGQERVVLGSEIGSEVADSGETEVESFRNDQAGRNDDDISKIRRDTVEQEQVIPDPEPSETHRRRKRRKNKDAEREEGQQYVETKSSTVQPIEGDQPVQKKKRRRRKKHKPVVEAPPSVEEDKTSEEDDVVWM